MSGRDHGYFATATAGTILGPESLSCMDLSKQAWDVMSTSKPLPPMRKWTSQSFPKSWIRVYGPPHVKRQPSDQVMLCFFNNEAWFV